MKTPPKIIWVDFDDRGHVVSGGEGCARYDGEHTYVRAQPFVTDTGRDMDEILDEAFRAVFIGEKE